MRLVPVLERELGLQVGLEHLRLLDATHHGLVERGLVRFPLLRRARAARLRRAEHTLIILRLLLRLTREVRVIDGRHLNTLQVHLLRRGDHVRLVDPLDRHAINRVRAGHEEKPAVKLLKEDNALSAEATTQEDEDGARGDRRAQLARLWVKDDVEGAAVRMGVGGGGAAAVAACGDSRRRVSPSAKLALPHSPLFLAHMLAPHCPGVHPPSLSLSELPPLLHITHVVDHLDLGRRQVIGRVEARGLGLGRLGALLLGLLRHGIYITR
mmetsp:Transcript_30022/g.80292  ORF Transcript_30022/g.80292 Transcript_30022/m.80292 type:complete len:268 (+) Transcript_30022:155-958(+)